MRSHRSLCCTYNIIAYVLFVLFKLPHLEQLSQQICAITQLLQFKFHWWSLIDNYVYNTNKMVFIGVHLKELNQFGSVQRNK